MFSWYFWVKMIRDTEIFKFSLKNYYFNFLLHFSCWKWHLNSILWNREYFFFWFQNVTLKQCFFMDTICYDNTFFVILSFLTISLIKIFMSQELLKVKFWDLEHIFCNFFFFNFDWEIWKKKYLILKKWFFQKKWLIFLLLLFFFLL